MICRLCARQIRAYTPQFLLTCHWAQAAPVFSFV